MRSIQQEASLFEFTTRTGIKLLEINQTSTDKPRLKLFKLNCDARSLDVDFGSWNTFEITEIVKRGKIFYTVKMNNELLVEKIDNNGQYYQNVNVYQGSQEKIKVNYKYFDYKQLEEGKKCNLGLNNII